MATGVWVGVELEEPLGSHNGTKGGKQYFPAREGHGIFVRPGSVVVLTECELDQRGLGSDDEI